MILTVSLNPAIDRTSVLAELLPGTVMRTKATVTRAGGKGINVSRAVRAAGGETLALYLKGGYTGEQLTALLAEERVPARAVTYAAETRISIQIAEEDGRFSNINDRGGPVTETDIDALSALVDELLTPSDTLVLGGALPTGAPEEVYARFVRAFSPRCRAVAVDADGPALRAAVKARPALLKPNEEELARYAGLQSPTEEELLASARALAGETGGAVLLSLGAAGAALVTEKRVLRALPTRANAVSTVGAGDSLLAGFLVREEAGGSPADCLRFGSAVATAKVECPGPTMPKREAILAWEKKIEVVETP